MVDKHTKLDDPLFNKCAHEENLACRKYLDEGLYTLSVTCILCGQILSTWMSAVTERFISLNWSTTINTFHCLFILMQLIFST